MDERCWAHLHSAACQGPISSVGVRRLSRQYGEHASGGAVAKCVRRWLCQHCHATILEVYALS